MLTLGGGRLFAQVLKPATWDISTSKQNVQIGEEVDIIFKVTIDKNWYLYSSDFDPDLGPMVTEFNFEPNNDYELVGSIKPVHPKKKYDDLWGGEYTYFKEQGEFRQTIKITGKNPIIKGSYSYQVCSDADGKCIPFDEEFEVDKLNTSNNRSSYNAVAENKEEASNSPIKTVNFGQSNNTDQPGILDPVKWRFFISKENPQKNDEVDLIFRASIDGDWYLYSSDVKLDPGPMPATFQFEPNDTYSLLGSIEPIGAEKKFDKIFSGEVNYFEDSAEFRQKIKILSDEFSISGNIEYQVCSETEGKCIPLEEEFHFGQPVTINQIAETGSTPATGKSFLNARDTYSPYSLLSFMIVAFLAGLAALLTPCVFPMIPMTVTFFTGKAKSRKKGIRNAFFYGLFIILIYTFIGSLVAPFMGAETANDLATNWIPNIIFFIVFLIFGLSFLGLFEITLPSSWVNKADQRADKGGIGGIFFMAFTLVLVSFSCTGPIVGTILVESAGGMIVKPILGMFAFSMAFAIPFTLFAIFPEWLSSLPKSGGWLNSVKVVLGFIELAFALKFLSIADQAYHWRLLDREIYLAFWIVIFTLLGFYMLGKLRLPNDSKQEITSVPRLILAIIIFSFVVYLIPGMFGAPLKALAGYLPPLSTHDFNMSALLEKDYYSTARNKATSLCEDPKYSDFLHFPHGIEGYFDYDQALTCARKMNKPIFIDFTGHGCVNCREMEARVWSDPEVLKRLKNDFIMLALYVDDKTELPQSTWYTSDYDGREKKTIGKQNADLQIRKFNNNAQPFYAIVDGNGELLEQPTAYDLNISNFIAFLDKGLKAYKNQK